MRLVTNKERSSAPGLGRNLKAAPAARGAGLARRRLRPSPGAPGEGGDGYRRRVRPALLFAPLLLLSACTPLVGLLNARDCEPDRFIRCEGDVSLRCEQGIEVRELCGAGQCNPERGGCGVCGDGETDAAFGEECDDGNQDERDACTNGCLAARCGDGIARTDITAPQTPGFEGCDDGNAANDDTCDSRCEITGCANGIANLEEVCYLPQVSLPTGQDPRDVASGDLDNDGDVDLVIPNFGPFNTNGTLSVLMNNGAGGFNALTVPTGKNPNAVDIGDLDNDGDLDIAIALSLPEEQLQVKLNAGGRDAALTFADAPRIPTNAGDPTALALGDFDEDGDLDIAAIAFTLGPRTIVLKLGDGAGNFPTEVSFAPENQGINPRSLALGDFDEDGDLDLIIGDDRADSSLFLLQLGLDGGGLPRFESAINFLDAGDNTIAVAFGDLDGDGAADIIAANQGSKDLGLFFAPFEVPISVAMPSPGEPAPGTTPRGAALGDFDNDGQTDLAVAGSAPDELRLLLNRGGRSFLFAAPLPLGPQISDGFPTGIEVADLNGDGVPDVAVGNRGNNTVSVILSDP